MGLFDGVFKPVNQINDGSLSAAEAFAAVCLVAIAADGYLSEQEGRNMTVMLSRMQLFRSYSNDMLHRTFDQLLGMLKRQGPGPLINLAKVSLPQNLRETAFAMATDLILSDGAVTEQEQAFLDDLHHILEISEDMALKIVQVMTIKNRG